MNIASIDIGTNTVLLLIIEYNQELKFYKTLRNELRMPRIGKGLSLDGNISQEKISELNHVLIEYKSIIDGYNVGETLVTGTQALRSAKNSSQVFKEVLNLTGYKIRILTGNEEAHLSFLGSTNDIDSENEFLIIDIGGGSTEIILGSKEKIKFKKSFKIGAVTVKEQFLISDPPEHSQIQLLEVELKKIFLEIQEFQQHKFTAIGVAGTPTTLSGISLGLVEFDSNSLEMSNLTKVSITNSIAQFSRMKSVEIEEKWSNLMLGRGDLILGGSLILLYILRLLGLDNILVSTKGLRYGVVYEYIRRRNQ